MKPQALLEEREAFYLAIRGLAICKDLHPEFRQHALRFKTAGATFL